MENSTNIDRSSLGRMALVMAVVGVAAAILAGVTDAFEVIWTFSRTLEVWEVDEVLVALLSALLVGLVMAMTRIRLLERRVAALEPSRPSPASAMRPNPRGRGLETIVKCTYCTKYKTPDEAWLADDEFIADRFDATVVAGVCPACRKPQQSRVP